jgi:hypothetical protein
MMMTADTIPNVHRLLNHRAMIKPASRDDPALTSPSAAAPDSFDAPGGGSGFEKMGEFRLLPLAGTSLSRRNAGRSSAVAAAADEARRPCDEPLAVQAFALTVLARQRIMLGSKLVFFGLFRPFFTPPSEEIHEN